MLVTASLDDESLEQLCELGEVRYEPMARTGRILTGSDLVRAVDGVQVLVTEADVVTEAEMAAFTTLRVICSCRGNPVNVDVPAATRHGLLVVNAPGRNAEAVSELTVALMVMLGRRVPAAAALMRDGAGGGRSGWWRRYLELRGSELWRRTVGLIGIGAVGGKVAERLRPFEVRLVGFDPYAPSERFVHLGVERLELQELITQSDYVSVHAAVTDTSRGLIGARELALMKPGAYFINTARSAITDQAALVQALRERRIAGAALDVFDEEPLPPEHPLFELENVILLPHIGGNTHEIALHQGRIVVPDLRRLANGERPLHVVNPAVLAGFRLAPGWALQTGALDTRRDPR